MVIEKTNNEIIFRLPADIDTTGFQRIVPTLNTKKPSVTARAPKSGLINWQTNQKNAGGKKIRKDSSGEPGSRYQ